MPIREFLKASGTRIRGGDSGIVYHGVAGRVVFRRAPERGIDLQLFGLLKHLVEALGISIHVSSVDTGKHAPRSRHYAGCAVDIIELAVGFRDWQECRAGNDLVEQLLRYLEKGGFAHGEGRPAPAVLFGPPGSTWNRSPVDHQDHIHLSIPRPT